jgi:hypothetical protein
MRGPAPLRARLTGDAEEIVTRTPGLTPRAELTTCSCRARLLDLAATDLTHELGPRLDLLRSTEYL